MPDDLTFGAVRLRAWAPDDAPWIYAGYNQPLVLAQTEQPDGERVDSVDRARRLIGSMSLNACVGRGIGLAICSAEDGDPLGSIELEALEDREKEAAIGFWTLEDHQGQGHASCAVTLAVQWALESLGIVRVWADIDRGNGASLAVVRKAGFGECAGATLPSYMPTRSTSLVLCVQR